MPAPFAKHAHSCGCYPTSNAVCKSTCVLRVAGARLVWGQEPRAGWLCNPGACRGIRTAHSSQARARPGRRSTARAQAPARPSCAAASHSSPAHSGPPLTCTQGQVATIGAEGQAGLAGVHPAVQAPPRLLPRHARLVHVHPPSTGSRSQQHACACCTQQNERAAPPAHGYVCKACARTRARARARACVCV